MPPNSRLAPQLVVAGQGNAPLWAVGLVPPGFAESLRVRSQDRLANGPSALILRVGVRGGLRLTMIAQMASAADANSLKLLINDEVGALSMAAQAWRLGRLVAAIEVEAVGTTVVANGTYSEREIEQLLAAIDNSWPNQQDAPPTPGLPPGGT